MERVKEILARKGIRFMEDNDDIIIPFRLEIELTKEEEEIIKTVYEIDYGCWGACGYASIERKEEGEKVRYLLFPCYCHWPDSYAIVFRHRRHNDRPRCC